MRAERSTRLRGGVDANCIYDTAIPVVVLKIGRYVYHAGGLGLIRSLGRAGVSVYGVHEDRFTPAALSKYLRGKFIWPTSLSELAGVLEGIEAIAKHLGRPAVLIPTDDAAAILIAENASALSHWFVFPRQPPGLPRKLADKAQLYRLCREMNVACAQTFVPQSADDLERFLERAAFPIVVKRTQPWRPGRKGIRGTEIVHTPARVLEIFRGDVAQQYSDLMLQEYIPDDCAEDWIFHGYADYRSECLASFTGVKHRSYPAYAGITTFGYSVDNTRLRAEAEGLIKALSYRGIMDMDYRFDSRDGRYKLLDFNPRVGAQFRMFQDERGIDVARALYLDLTGRAVPKRVRTQPRYFIVECFDLLAAIRYLRAGDLTLREWGRTLKTIDEAAFFARDDVLPFLAMAVRFIGHGALRTIGIRREGRAKGAPRHLQGRGHQAPSGQSRKDPAKRLRPLVKRIYNRLRGLKASGPIILHYHRVADALSDPWALCVAPHHFAEQLEVLRRSRSVLPLGQMVHDAREGCLAKDAVAITFDDGYRDNLYQAVPLLERFDAPATIFFATGYIGGREFWWDELERIVLLGKWLTPTLRLPSLGEEFECERDWPVASRSTQAWRAWQTPPTSRHAAYLAIWRRLRVLPTEKQRDVLDDLRASIECGAPGVPEWQCALTTEEARTLAGSALIEIGAHTVTHAMLAEQPRAIQYGEIRESKRACENLIGREVVSFAYPYGGQSRATTKLVKEAGFVSACSTKPGTVGRSTDPFTLPRIAIGNWGGDLFARLLADGIGTGPDRQLYEQ